MTNDWEIDIWSFMNEVLENKMILKCWSTTNINLTALLPLHLIKLCKYVPIARFRKSHKRNTLTSKMIVFDRLWAKWRSMKLENKRKREKKPTFNLSILGYLSKWIEINLIPVYIFLVIKYEANPSFFGELIKILPCMLTYRVETQIIFRLCSYWEREKT